MGCLQLDKEVERDKWGMTPPTINAYYTPTKNQVKHNKLTILNFRKSNKNNFVTSSIVLSFYFIFAKLFIVTDR